MSDTVESLLVAEQRTLQMIAGGASLAEVLDDLCRTIDAQAPDAISSVLLMDPDGKRLRPGAVSRVPSGFIQAIAPLTIGPCVGSCGTAAFLQKRVIVSDIANDPLWAPFRDLALSYGFRAGWSQPIVSKDKQVLGTFGLYYMEPRVPTASELRLIEGAGLRTDCDRDGAYARRTATGACRDQKVRTTTSPDHRHDTRPSMARSTRRQCRLLQSTMARLHGSFANSGPWLGMERHHPSPGCGGGDGQMDTRSRPLGEAGRDRNASAALRRRIPLVHRPRRAAAR